MSTDNSSIHDFDFNLICEYFSHFERQGPGSPEITLKALSFIDNLGDNSRIADIGCGTGGQTLMLARHASGRITAIDLFPRFIELLQNNSREEGLDHRIKAEVGNMEDLPFGEEELDLIWSEGAIYNIGFQRGLKEWRRFLKNGGYIAVTEACWFSPRRPAEIHEFWMDAYPEIDTIPNKMAQLQDAGYLPLASFILPDECWTRHFFEPQAEVQRTFADEHPGQPAALQLVENMLLEAEMYRKYKKYYGYVFFIGRKENFNSEFQDE